MSKKQTFKMRKMMSCFCYGVAASTVLFTFCTNPVTNENHDFDGIYAHQPAVDMTPVLEVYEWVAGQRDTVGFDEFTLYNSKEFLLKLIPECERYSQIDVMDDELENNWFVRLTDTVSLSCNHGLLCNNENAAARETFMLDAENLYNGHLLIRNLNSLFDLWKRNIHADEDEKTDTGMITEAIEGLNTDVITDTLICNAAKESVEAILSYMRMDQEQREHEPDPMDVLMFNDELIEWEFCRRFGNDDIEQMQLFMDSINAIIRKKHMAEERHKRYTEAGEDEQLGVMLSEMADCKDFDGQCALWCMWANCPESVEEDDWLIATGVLLMESGKYNPLLDRIWLTWRTLFQYQFGGLSKDSVIPNDFYNEYRRKCFRACVMHRLKHPEDRFSLTRALSLAYLENLYRMTGWFGNAALDDMARLMPKRIGN